MSEKIEVLHERAISGGDSRWPIKVKVERRTTEMNGKMKTYINLLVSIGDRSLFIPRRASSDVANAINELAELASVEYENVLRESNKTRK